MGLGATPFPLGFFKKAAAGGGGAPFGGLVSTNNLKAHWRLNEESGSRVDVHAAENLTDNNTVGFAAGKLGNAADFIPANSEFLSRANDPDLVIGDTDYTFSVWVKSDDVAAAGTIIGMWGDTFANNGYRLYQNGAGAPVFQLQRTATDDRNITSATNFVAGTWYFICAGHNAGADQVFISVNAGDKQTATSGGTVDVVATEGFRLGANAGASPLFWDGLIDSVSAFREVLADADIDDLYNAGNGLDY